MGISARSYIDIPTVVKIAKRGNPGLILHRRNKVKLRERRTPKRSSFVCVLESWILQVYHLKLWHVRKKGDNFLEEEWNWYVFESFECFWVPSYMFSNLVLVNFQWKEKFQLNQSCMDKLNCWSIWNVCKKLLIPNCTVIPSVVISYYTYVIYLYARE